MSVKEPTVVSPVKVKEVPGVEFSMPGQLKKEERVLQHSFTAVIPIPAPQAEVLFKLLSEFGHNLGKDPFIPFSSISTIHYCRFFIVDEALEADGSKVSPRLVFNMVTDGDPDITLHALFTLGESGMNKVLSFVPDYPLAASAETRAGFLKKFSSPQPLFWAARKGATASIIQKEGLLRESIQQYLDGRWKIENLSLVSPHRLYSDIQDHIRKDQNLCALLDPVKGTSAFKAWTRKNANILFLIPTLLVVIVLLPVLICWVLLARYFEARYNRKTPPPVRKPLHEVLENEDRIFQNQLTIYGTLKTPLWFYRTNLKVFLAFANLKMKFTAIHGNLGGIATIHFVGWALFNKDRNVMFLSNYDGGWESYLNEFIDNAASVMNISFGSMIGYPPTRWILGQGAHNEQAFKAVVRDHQYPCPVWYSAYPMISIRNILRNAEIRDGLRAGLKNENDIKAWLQLL